MKNRKRITIPIIILPIIIIGIIIIKEITSTGVSEIKFAGKKDNYSLETSADSASKDIIKDMGLGWNYGGGFANFSGGSNLKKDQYQLLLTYQSNPYTQWDEEGNYPYFNGTTGKISIDWKMDSLKSTGPVGSFGIKIVNQGISNSGNTKVKYKIENTKLVLANGTNIEIGGEGTYSSTIVTDNATEEHKIDLSGISGISDTSDLSGATVSMDISIIDYAVQQTAKTEKTVNTAIFDAVKAAGFNTVRVPVTFIDYIDSEGNVDDAYLEQIKVVVDAIMQRGMYCVIDLHHDAGNLGWLSVGYVDEHKTKFQNIWKQVATKFANYDYHLIFEGVNEPLNFLQPNIWDVYDTANVPSESIQNVNKLNQYFVDAVRQVNGNEKRFLMVSSYANKEFAYTATYQNNTRFQLPQDTATDKLMIDAHIYTVGNSEMDWRVNTLKSSGYPVCIGEFGLYSSELTDDTKRKSQIYLVEKAAEAGIQCSVWDDGGSMAVLKASQVTDSNYTSKDIWNGSTVNYVPDLVAASKTESLTTVPVESVSLTPTTGTVEEGKTINLTATVTPSTATNKNVTWSSSDESIATVENGKVTGVKAGTATITVTTEDGNKTATATITVSQTIPTTVPVESVSITPTTGTVEEGKTINLTATVTPSIATNKNITWSSSDESIATVENGVVTGVKAGTATITVTTEDGNKTATATITVSQTIPTTVPVESVSLTPTTGTVEEGKTINLTATVTPSTATNKNVTWSSSDESIATVENGVVTGVKAGTATITVTTEDGNKTATATITVSQTIPTTVPVQGVSLNKTEGTMKIGEKETLVATITPSTATNKNVTWSSSDESIATVENGVVTAIGEGEATITVTTEDENKTATCKIVVEKEVTPIVATIKYDKTEQTKDSVTATITFDRDNVTITNNEGKNTYTFDKNGEFTFKYEDEEGNIGETTAKVTWIVSETDFNVDVKYSTTEQTKDGVTVTIESETELQELEGWKLSEDKHTLTKVYKNNTEEIVTIKDINGNTKAITIKIQNIKEEEKDDDNNQQNINKNTINYGGNSEKANTANTILPKAGKSGIIIAILIVMTMGVMSYIKLKEYRDVK